MNSITRKISTAIKNPKLAIIYLKSKHNKWKNIDGLSRKEYSTYEDYINHQKEKLDVVGEKFLSDGKVFGEQLEERIRLVGLIKQGMSVLCLGARLGFEVESFIRCGCFAVGIDLNPGKDNKHVVVGDFHNIDFADSSVDVVFTNSLDHSLDVVKVISEIKRVLKDNGLVIIEANLGTEEGYSVGYYESYAWKHIEDLFSKFTDIGFKEINRQDIVADLYGKQIIFKIKK